LTVEKVRVEKKLIIGGLCQYLIKFGLVKFEKGGPDTSVESSSGESLTKRVHGSSIERSGGKEER